MVISRRRFVAATAALPFGAHVYAQTYPVRPVRLVIPFPPGGAFDAVGRPWAEKMKALLGTLVVENIGGGGSSIGASVVARAKPDGYTVLLGGTQTHVNEALLKTKQLYDPLKDLDPVAGIVAYPLCIAVHPSLPMRTLKELVAYAKANPGNLSYGHAGLGSIQHLTGELFKSLTATAGIVQVPYRGTGPAITDLIGGQIQLQFDAIATSLPHIKAGKARALAVSSAKRSTILPDMPSIAETVPGFNMVGWQGFLVPAGTPGEIIQRLHREIAAVFASPEVRQRMFELGYETVGSSPREFAEFMRADTAQFAKIISGAGIRPE